MYYRQVERPVGVEVHPAVWDLAETLIRPGHKIGKIATIKAIRAMAKAVNSPDDGLLFVKTFAEWKAAQVPDFSWS